MTSPSPTHRRGSQGDPRLPPLLCHTSLDTGVKTTGQVLQDLGSNRRVYSSTEPQIKISQSQMLFKCLK